MKRTIAALFVCGLFSAAVLAEETAYIGVMLGTLDDAVMKKLNYDGRGAYVTDIVKDGPADKAGMKDRDIIVAIGNDAIAGPGHLRDILDYHRPGDTVTVTVWRGGKRETLTVELGGKKSMLSLDTDDIAKTIVISGEPTAWLGIRTQELSEQLGEHFGAKAGVLVSEVIDESPAATAGFMAGDVITKVGSEPVEHPLELTKVLGDKEPGDTVALVFIRDGKATTKDVTLAEAPKKYRKGWPQVFTWDDDGTGFGLSVLPDLPHFPQLFEKRLQAEEEMESEELQRELRELRESLTEEMKSLRAELDELKKNLKHTN